MVNIFMFLDLLSIKLSVFTKMTHASLHFYLYMNSKIVFYFIMISITRIKKTSKLIHKDIKFNTCKGMTFKVLQSCIVICIYLCGDLVWYGHYSIINILEDDLDFLIKPKILIECIVLKWL